eukprot:scaffold560733_cov63-Attheya_sp.AAC.1
MMVVFTNADITVGTVCCLGWLVNTAQITPSPISYPSSSSSSIRCIAKGLQRDDTWISADD